MEGLHDTIQGALVVVLAISALQLFIKTLVTPNASPRFHRTSSDLESALLEHVGASEEELQTAIAQAPHRTALRILYPLEILLTASMSAWCTLAFVATLRAHHARAQLLVLSLGWGSQTAALTKARASLAGNSSSPRLLRRELSTWTVVALAFYAATALMDVTRVSSCGAGVAACLVCLVIEAAVAFDREPSDSPQDGRQREKSWVLLLGAAVTYVWPRSFQLQLRAISCLFLVVCIRVLNIAVPFAYKKVIDSFSEASGTGDKTPFANLAYPWVVLYLIFSLFQGGTGGGTVGLLSNLRQFLWIPISQEAYKRLSIDIFAHVLSLDHNFHLHRKTGELLRIMDRGTVSVQTLLGTIMYVPMHRHTAQLPLLTHSLPYSRAPRSLVFQVPDRPGNV